MQRPDLYHERPSGESGEQQQVRRLKICRGLKAAKALGSDSQNETGGVEEDGGPNETDGVEEDRRLRFQVGDMVEVNSWEYAPGTIIATCVYGNGYLIRLPDDGSVVWATADIDKYFHAAVPLRFPLGFRAEANMGQFYAPGKVIAHYDNGRAYRIQLDDTQQEVWAREDSDQFVRAAAPVCHDHSRVRYTGHGFIKYPNGTVYWGNSVRALREMYRGVRKKM